MHFTNEDTKMWAKILSNLIRNPRAMSGSTGTGTQIFRVPIPHSTRPCVPLYLLLCS